MLNNLSAASRFLSSACLAVVKHNRATLYTFKRTPIIVIYYVAICDVSIELAVRSDVRANVADNERKCKIAQEEVHGKSK